MLHQLPDGYVDQDRGSSRVIATRLQLNEMVRLLAPGTRETVGEAVQGGRGGTRRVKLAGGNVIYLRHYLRGGFIRHFLRDRFLLRPLRPVHELIATHRARAAGCRVPLVQAVAIEDAGPFYRGWIITSAMPVVATFAEAFAGVGEGKRAELLGQAGRAVRAQHDAGVYHVDLTGENLLLDREGQIVTVDFDRAVMAAPGNVTRSKAGLDRLWRSLRKLSKERSFELDDAERNSLETGYKTGEAPADEEGILNMDASGDRAQ
ncbi:MAG: 3-deoxy-D-manno-octulosonic acid kinase [Hyphomicrobiaceae bacterium]